MLKKDDCVAVVVRFLSRPVGAVDLAAFAVFGIRCSAFDNIQKTKTTEQNEPIASKPMRKNSRQLSAFHTGLMTSDYYRFPRPPIKGHRWRVDLVLPANPPTSPRSRVSATLGGEVVGRKRYPEKEVMIRASSRVTAQRPADLIRASRLVLVGSNIFFDVIPGEHAPIYPASEKSDVFELPPRTRIWHSNIPLACMLAARASFSLEYVYALAKLRLSIETSSTPLLELDPDRSENVPKSPLPEDHVRFAFAIVAAWSCVEELGLEIRASQNNPSKLPNGNWNPVVKAELEQRLRRNHIDLKEPISWNLRGSRTRIETRRLPAITKKAEWARYQVRDGDMEVIDAIHYVSFLRSWVAAHRADKRMVRVLSIYD